MKHSRDIIEFDDNFPNGAFLNGVFVNGKVVDGQFIRQKIFRSRSNVEMTEEANTEYLFHMSLIMEKTFGERFRRKWWHYAKKEFHELQAEMVNGKRRIKFED